MSRFIDQSISWLKKSFSESEEERSDPSAAAAAAATSTSLPPNEAVSGAENRLAALDLDYDFDEPPELRGTSVILRDDDVAKLVPYLPSRLIGASWRLVFSTETDGFSLKSIYRSMSDMKDMPAMILIHDTDGYRFGALVSDCFRVHDRFYGTGETFLFRLGPEFKCYPWKKKNTMVINCSNEYLSIGAGQGHFGISLDSDLNHGRTLTCETYENEPLNPNEDFCVKTVEVWTFD